MNDQQKTKEQLIAELQQLREQVAERQQVEQELRKRQELQQGVIDNTTAVVYVKDVDGRYLLVNRQYEELFNVKRDEIRGQTDHDIFPAELADAFRANDLEVLKAGVSLQSEELAPHEDGLHTYISLKFPLLDAAGQTYAVAGISTDITESKRAEAERERLLKIIETSKDFIAMATPEGKGTYLNPGGLKMTGYTADEFYGGMSIADFQPTLPREALETAVKEGSWSGEAAFVAKDGREILTSQVITALKDDDGNLQGFSTIARDISEQKKAEELATVAEVSTIVSGILDTQEMLQLVVDLIKERFNLYHSHIYLLDEISENLTLAAGAGEVGRQMVTEGWQIPLDREQSLVARAARTRQGVIINDVRAEPGFLPNPLLPHAAAELAAPLIVGEQVLGVLDVQADEINRFTQEDINVQNTLSSQIAVALQNARRHEQTEVALNELTRLQRIMTREGWQVFMTSAERPFDGYLAGRDAVHPIVQAQPNDGNGAAGDGAVTTIASLTAGDTSITAPMTVRGVTIGGLGLRDPSGQPVSAENREFLEALSRQVADALEQARLVEETQKASFLLGERVKELNCLNDIGHKMEETPPVDEFLQWVAERIPPAMQYPDICVAAIELEDQVYGVPEVLNLPCKIMGGIRVGGELVGGVHIAYTEERDFLDEESALVGGVVRRVSGYIENQRLIEQTQAALDETATLYTGSERVVRAPTTGDILLALVESTVIQQFDRANIMFFDEVWDDTPPDGFSVSAVWERSGEPSRAPAGTHYSRAQVPFLSVIERDKPFFIHDVVTDTHVDENTRAVLTRLGMRSLTIFPLVAGEQWIGALTVQGSTPIEITENQIRQIESLAGQAATVLRSQRLFDEAQKRATELATVAKVSATASTELDTGKLLQSVVNLTKTSFDLYHAHIYLLDDTGKNLVLTAGAGEIGQEMVTQGWQIPLEREQSLVAQAARTRQGIIVDDVQAAPGFLSNPLLPDTRSEMAVPLIVGDQVLGVLDVQSDKHNYFTGEDVRIQTTLAAQVAVALQNANLYVEQAATVARLKELDYLRSAFLANMSHELRTPLNSILGFTEVILAELDGPLTEQMEYDLGVIHKNGEHLLNLINEVLDMAKIEAGQMNISFEPVDLKEILEDVLITTAPLAREKSLVLRLDVAEGDALNIQGDPVRLQQVMLNLVGNAIKFTEEGSVVIEVRRANGKIRICIRDTGIGIPEEHLGTIFEAFHQVDTTTTRKTGGTGLGLPISKHLIELHGGHVWVESTGIPGEGSEFFIEMEIEE